MAAGAAKIRGLLQWCKRQVEGYPGVEVANFTKSFRDGLAFCAIIHRYRPELIDFYALSKENVLENNDLAYSVAEKELGIPPLLDAEDMVAVSIPDRLSVITYVSQYYNCFANKTPLGGPNVVAAESEKPMMVVSNRSSGQSVRKSETPLTSSNHDVCAICHKRVYMLERQHHNDELFHRNCLRRSQVKAIGEKVKSLERGAHLKRNLAVPTSHAENDDPEDGSSSIKRRSPSPATLRTSPRIQPNSTVGLPVPTSPSNPPDHNSAHNKRSGSTNVIPVSPGSSECVEPASTAASSDVAKKSVLEASREAEATVHVTEAVKQHESEGHTSKTTNYPTKPHESSQQITMISGLSEKSNGRPESPTSTSVPPKDFKSLNSANISSEHNESSECKTAVEPESSKKHEPISKPTESPLSDIPSVYEGKRDVQPTTKHISDAHANSANFVRNLIQKRMNEEKQRVELRSRSRSPPRVALEKSDADSLPRASTARMSGRHSYLGDHPKRRAPPPPPSFHPAAQSSSSPSHSSTQSRRSTSPFYSTFPMRPSAPAIVLPAANDKDNDEEYPEDLNPFADDDEVPSKQQPLEEAGDGKEVEDVAFEYRGKNPFDVDDEEHPCPPPLNTLSSLPTVPVSEYRGKNPFDSDSGDDTSSHDLSSLSTSSIRQSSRRKKRHAPPPPQKAAQNLTPNGETATPPDSELSPSSTFSGLAELSTSTDIQENGKRLIAVTVNEGSPVKENDKSTVAVKRHLRKIVPPEEVQASSEGEDSEISHSRKGPAPSLPMVSRRCVRTDADEEYVPYSQLIAELEQVNEEQLQLENKGQQLENELRNAEKRFPIAEDADTEGVNIGAEVDALLVSWLELIEDKNQLFKKEGELHYRIRQRELEERHADIEFELRQLLAKQDNLKTAEDKRREDLLLQDLQACVRDRSELIYAIDEDHQRKMPEIEEPRIITICKKKKFSPEKIPKNRSNDEEKHKTRVLGPKFSNVLCMSSKLKKKSKDDKKEKKKKKKEKKEKKV